MDAAAAVGDEIKKKALLSSMVGEGEANLGHLSGDILKEVVDRIPMKSLSTMKLLSKAWRRLISDTLIRSKTQPSSSTLAPTIQSAGMEQQAPQQPCPDGHSVDIDRERIRYRAILKRMFPASELNESDADGVCQWCLQKFDHASRDECPAGDLTFYPLSHFSRKVSPPPPPSRNYGIAKIYFLGEVSEADVQNLFEPFGALRLVRLRELRDKGIILCSAIVNFVNADDAKKAVTKLKEDGYNVKLYQ